MKRESINFIGISDVSRGILVSFTKGINDAPETRFRICLMNYLRILRMVQRLYYDEGSNGLRKRQQFKRGNCIQELIEANEEKKPGVEIQWQNIFIIRDGRSVDFNRRYDKNQSVQRPNFCKTHGMLAGIWDTLVANR